jgi:hypothetical protein
MERDFAEDVKVNKYKLEIECEKQASTYFYWANELADAKTRLNEAEDALKLIYATADLATRHNWNESLNGKSTESSIKSVIETSKDVLQGKEDVRDAQSAVNTLFAAVGALDHRKSELDNLVTLLVKGFYAAPNGGKREGPTESAERDVRKKLNKRE